MDNFYGSESMLDDPSLSNAVYKISCDYPHNIEFFEEFFYTRSINETTDDIDEYADELCGTAFNVKFSTLDEIKSKRTKAGWPYNDIYFTYNIQKAENNEEFRILCLLGYSSEIIDIKTDYSIVDLLNKKIFKLNPKKSSPGRLIIGILITATIIKIETKIIFVFSILIFMYWSNLFLKE